MKSRFQSKREYIETIVIACFLALFVRSYILTGYKVPTSSMAPTLMPGDFIFAYRLPHGIKVPFSNAKIAVHAPKRGQVVVFTYPEQPRIHYVKRVIGLPGDQIKIVNSELFINDNKLNYEAVIPENGSGATGDYFKEVREIDSGLSRHILVQKDGQAKSFGPIVVPPGEVFLMGDNRDTSDDSRYWGTVPISRIESSVNLIWFSVDWQNKTLGNRLPSVRWGRVMKGVD